MTPAQQRAYDALLAAPPQRAGSADRRAFWLGWAKEGCAAIKVPGVATSPVRAAFLAGREARRREVPLPQSIRDALPNLFADLE